MRVLDHELAEHARLTTAAGPTSAEPPPYQAGFAPRF